MALSLFCRFAGVLRFYDPERGDVATTSGVLPYPGSECGVDRGLFTRGNPGYSVSAVVLGGAGCAGGTSGATC